MTAGMLERVRALLECTYTDTARLLRPVPRRAGTVEKAEFEILYDGLPCALSRLGDRGSRAGERSARGDAAQTVAWDAVVFLPPEPQLLPGDRAVVRRLGETVEMEIMGLPARYETHQEALVRQRRNG